jgi:hypothetical protein
LRSTTSQKAASWRVSIRNHHGIPVTADIACYREVRVLLRFRGL